MRKLLKINKPFFRGWGKVQTCLLKEKIGTSYFLLLFILKENCHIVLKFKKQSLKLRFKT